MGFRFGAGVSLAVLLVGGAVGAQPASEAAYKAVGKTASAPTLTAPYGTDPLQKGQLRLPPGKGPFPVAVVIHGGCWSKEFDDINGIAGVADALTKRGLATWNIGYRRLGDDGAGWPGTFRDVGAGIDHLAVLAKDQPLDLSRVTLVGHSAGAHLALWGASRGKLGAEWAPVVKPVSVVAIDGPAALAPFVGIDENVCGKPVITSLMGGAPTAKPDDYRMASPAEQLPLGMRQVLVQAAFTPFMQPYAKAAEAAGDKVDVFQGSPDHFKVVTPGQDEGDRVIDFIVERAFAR